MPGDFMLYLILSLNNVYDFMIATSGGAQTLLGLELREVFLIDGLVHSRLPWPPKLAQG